jgi:autotransporter passenger strand-loop-strand repeat protein
LANANSTSAPDGSTFNAFGQPGGLVTQFGTFTFNTALTGTTGDATNLNGAATGQFGIYLVVANGGNVYDWQAFDAGWLEFNATSGFFLDKVSGPRVIFPQAQATVANGFIGSLNLIAADNNSGTIAPLTASGLVTITGVPPTSVGSVFNGGTAVTSGTTLTPTELSTLTFAATSDGQAGTYYLSYTVTDEGLSVPEPALAITVKATAPIVSPSGFGGVLPVAVLTVGNTAATPIQIPVPTDPNFLTSQLSITIISLPSDGTVLANGIPITAGQLPFVLPGGVIELTTGLQFELTPGASQASDLLYTVTNPAGGYALGAVSLVPAVLTTPGAVTVAPNAGPSAIDIVAPTAIFGLFPITHQPYSFYPASALNATITQLPTDGTLLLSSGGTTTPVSAGETLTIDQLTNGLEFQPTSGAVSETSILTYTVTDPAGASGVGSATLSIGRATSLWQDQSPPVAGGAGIDGTPAVPQPRQLGQGIVGFDLQNTGGATEPAGYVTFGQVFRDGDVSANAGLTAFVVSGGVTTGNAIPVQMTVETTYADGSVDDAILTLSAPAIAAGGTVSALLVTSGGASPAAPITPAQAVSDLLANGDVTVSVAISGGSTFTVSASEVLAAAITSNGTVPLQALWMSGPQVSEYLVSTTVDGGALEIEFDIRAYADGATTADVIFSTAVTSITSGSGADHTVPPATAPGVIYGATISEGGTAVYTTSGLNPTTTPGLVQQYPYSEWDYQVFSSQSIAPNLQYDLQYLEAAGALQNYNASLGASSAQISGNLAVLNPGNTSAGVFNSFGPLGTANADTQMIDASGRQDLAPEPNWTALWLLSQDAAARQDMMDNAAAGGSAPWNIIDAATGQPVNLVSYNNFDATQANGYATMFPANGLPLQTNAHGVLSTDGDPWGLAADHEPDLNYVPALITGSPYQLQLLQDQANFSIDWVTGYGTSYDTTGTASPGVASSFINNPLNLGADNGSNGNQIRAVAWELRQVAEAAYLTPNTGSEEALKQYYTTELDNAMNGLVQEYVTDNINSLFGQLSGFVQGSSGPQPLSTQIAIYGYMEDYFITSLGLVAGLNIPQASADAVAMLEYTNNYIAGLFTNGANGFNPLDGTVYNLQVVDPITGQPYTTWNQLFNGNLGPSQQFVANPPELINTPPDLNFALGGYGPVAAAALASEITYTQSPQAMQAYGFVESEDAYIFSLPGNGGAAAEAGFYQQYPQFAIVPQLADGQYLNYSQMLIDTSGHDVTLNAASIAGLQPGQDALVAVVGSGTATLIGNSVGGGIDLLYGDAGATTLVAGAGADYLFGGTGNTTFIAGTGNDYLQGGATLSSNVGAANLTSNTYVIGQGVISGGHRVTTIANFNPSNDQLVVFGNLDGNGIVSATDLLASAVSVSGGNTVVELDLAAPGTDQVILLGVGGGLTTADVQVATYPGVVSSGMTLTVSSPDQFTSAVLSGGLLVVSGAGQTVIPVTISGGGSEIVAAGGLAGTTIVLGGASQTVLSGGTASGAVISGGATEIVAAGGAAIGAQVQNGGGQFVSGGTASGTTVSAAGSQTVAAGGAAVNAAILSGGAQFVSGGAASGTSVFAGGNQYVSAGGTASGTSVAGRQSVLTGGTAGGATVLGGGEQIVSGGAAGGTTVSAGGSQLVSAGGTASGATILGGANQFVSGGTAVATTLSAGGNETIAAGGTASGTIFAGGNATVLAGGTLFVLSGQQASGVTLNGGDEVVEAGGQASATLVLNGSREFVAGAAVGAIVSVGGSEIVSGAAATAGGTTVATGGSQVVTQGGTASGATIESGGAQVVSATGVTSGTSIAGSQSVLTGGTAIGAQVESGGSQFVSGGTASGTTVSAVGSQTVAAGGAAVSATLLSGGVQFVSGGTALATTLAIGGIEVLSAGGTASGTIFAGGTAIVRGGGTLAVQAGTPAVGAVLSGGTEIVSAGAVASGTLILSGGQEIVSGSAVSAAVASGGAEIVSAGGSASGATVSAGGTQTIAGGSASGTVVSAGGSEIVQAGTASGTTVLSGGGETVAGGVAGGTFVAAGGSQVVAPGGTALNATIAGSETVSAGGTATGATILNGGTDTVFGSAGGTVLSNGGVEVVAAGGTVTGATILSGGFERVLASGTADGATILGGGQQDVFGTASGTSVQGAGLQFVESGAVAGGTGVSGGGGQLVLAFGTAVGGTIAGSQTVLSGGAASGATILGGGVEIVSGTATDATVLSGGNQIVLGLAIGTTVDSGGTQTVSAGGSASGGAIAGSQTVLLGATAVGATVLSGGEQLVFGSAGGTIVSGGGIEIISGGAASGTVVMSGGTEQIVGSATGTTISAGGNEIVSAGGTATSATVAGRQSVLSGGIALGAAIGGGGNEIVSGGRAIGATVSNGGSQSVLSGGVVLSAAVLNGGSEIVSSGGLASSTLLLNGGQLLLSGGTAIGTIYGNGTSANVSAGSTAASPVVSGGGVLVVLSGGTVSNPFITNGGTLTLDDGATIGGGVTFAGTNGTLTISGTTGPVVSSGTVISNFAPGDAIDIVSLPLSSVTSYGLVSGSVLEIAVSGGATYDLHFAQVPGGGATFVLYGDLQVGLAGLLPSGGLTLPPGTSATISASMLQFSDPSDADPNAATSQTYTLTSAPADGTLLLNGAALAANDTFTQADINSGGVQYSETTSVTSQTADAFNFTVTDGVTSHTASGTFGITIAASVQPPSLVNDNPLSLTGGTASTITGGLLDFSDQVSQPPEVTYIIATAPVNGTLLSGTTALTAGDTFTQQDIDNGAITYSASVTTAATDSFDFTVKDAGGAVTPTQQFTITITPAAVLSGQTVVASSGQVFTGVTVFAGGTLDIAAGGTASGTVVSGVGASEVVSAGGLDAAATIEAGGAQLVLSGGIAFDMALIASGLQNVFGTVSGAVIGSGGTEIVGRGGMSVDAVISAGGIERLTAGGATSATVIAGGLLGLTSGTQATGSIAFAAGPSGGTLQIAGSLMPLAAISGFSPGDTIDLTGIAYSSAGTVTVGAGNVLQISENGSTYDMVLAPGQHFRSEIFELSADSHGGTMVGLTERILWTNRTTGDTGYWTFSNGNVAAFQDLSTGNPAYHAITIGNFDGASQSEVLWENTVTGDAGYWTVSNGTVTGFHDFGQAANPTYSIVGIGDFTGSGQDQVLFSNAATGDTGWWVTNGSGVVTGFHDLGAAAPGYSVIGIGDFAGSGRETVLWQNANTGDTGYWLIDGSGAVTGFQDLGTATPGYAVVGIGDFDNSGHDEVLFENKGTAGVPGNGDTGYWVANGGGAATGFHDFGFADLAYSIAGVGKYDNSGHDEILWENPGTGDAGYWTTNAAGQVTGFHDLGAASTNYHFVPQ